MFSSTPVGLRPMANRMELDRDNVATRNRLLTLLRQGTWTVDDLARSLEITDNAVRFHIAAFEREGTVRRGGVRKPPGAGQPAVLYSLTPEAEDTFSRAYAPVLTACLLELRETMSTNQLVRFLRKVGKRIARGVPATGGSLSSRVGIASDFLNDLGGLTTVEESEGGFRIVGQACPLASAVETDPCVCSAVTSLVSQVVGAEVTESCDRSGRPRCCFEIRATSEPIRSRKTLAG